MNALVTHIGVCAPILLDNVDTDQIIPSREMNTVSKAGLGRGLFAGWRYVYAGPEKVGLNEAFALNKPEYAEATILLGGRNFGCGSSREHAVWALRDFGIRAILAQSFGSIFQSNCARNGLLAICLSDAEIDAIRSATENDPQRNHLTIDLERLRIRLPGGQPIAFEIDAHDRGMLMSGLDYVDVALQYVSAVDQFKDKDRFSRPWAYL